MSDDLKDGEKVVEIGVKRERANQASELLDPNGVYLLAVKSLRRRWYDEWLRARDNRLQADRLQWQSIALDEITTELDRFITDYKFALDRQKKHG
jgi:hypothetical protein